MNILVITELYPGNEEESELDSTYFLHYITQNWSKDNNVKVINTRRIYPKILNFINKFNQKNKYYNDYKFVKDNVSVYRFGIKAIPIPKITEVEIGIERNLKKIKNELDQENFYPEIIICHMMYPSFNLAIKLKKNYKIPLVLSFHSWDEAVVLRDKKNKKILEKNISNIDVFGFRSISLKEKINKLIKIPSTKSIIVNSGIEKENIIDLQDLNIKINRKNKVISTVARLEKRKNIDVLIKAFSKLKNKDNLVFNIIGDGDELNALKELVKSFNLEKSINFLGKKKRDEVLNLLKQSDIFTLVSSRETLGLVYLEAMSQGCIVIGSKGEGIDGIINNNINGYLVEKQDVDGLAKVIEKIIGINKIDKNEMLSNSINTITNLTNEKVANRYLENIFDVINNSTEINI